MRTTLTLDEDVAAKLRSKARRSGKSFKRVVNDCLRIGLHSEAQLKALPPFKLKPHNMGLRPGVNLNDVWGLIELLEEPVRR